MRSSAVPTVVSVQDPAESPRTVRSRVWYLVKVGLEGGARVRHGYAGCRQYTPMGYSDQRDPQIFGVLIHASLDIWGDGTCTL
jgi:hypothetical protein